MKVTYTFQYYSAFYVYLVSQTRVHCITLTTGIFVISWVIYSVKYTAVTLLLRFRIHFLNSRKISIIVFEP